MVVGSSELLTHSIINSLDLIHVKTVLAKEVVMKKKKNLNQTLVICWQTWPLPSLKTGDLEKR